MNDSLILDELIEKCRLNIVYLNNLVVNRKENSLDKRSLERLDDQLEVWEVVKEYIEENRTKETENAI